MGYETPADDRFGLCAQIASAATAIALAAAMPPEGHALPQPDCWPAVRVREPAELIRDFHVRVKLNLIGDLVRGKRVVVPGLANKIATVLPRLLPRGLILSIVQKAQMKAAKSVPKL